MDFPISDESAGLHNGKFTNGDPSNDIPPSKDSAEYQNWVFDEIIAAIVAGGETPDETKQDQLAAVITKALSGGELVGVPIPWPSETVPDGYIAMIGQSFDPLAFPKLALAYPDNTLPDMRGEYIRGWDNGRGVDVGRELLSHQMDAMQRLTGTVQAGSGRALRIYTSGVFVAEGYTAANKHGSSDTSANVRAKFDNALQARTADENRSRNYAFNYIVRAA